MTLAALALEQASDGEPAWLVLFELAIPDSAACALRDGHRAHLRLRRRLAAPVPSRTIVARAIEPGCSVRMRELPGRTLDGRDALDCHGRRVRRRRRGAVRISLVLGA